MVLKRRRERGAGPGKVILRDPFGQLDDVRRHEGAIVEHLRDRLDGVRGVGRRGLADRDPRQRARTDRHHHSRPGMRHRLIGRDAIREEAECRNRHRD
jgi:hypothetical protein